MLSNLPPGCRDCDLPGAYDMTVSYSITFKYITDLDNEDDIYQSITSYTGISDLTFHDDTHTINSDGSHSIDISYSDDIEIDPRGMDASDIEHEIIKHTNNMIRDANINYTDDITMDYEVHR